MLHIIKSSPFVSHALTECLQFIGDGDTIIFIQDAVVAVASHHQFSALLANLPDNIGVYVLSEDLIARGLTCQVGKAINYKEFVGLTLSCRQNQTWK